MLAILLLFLLAKAEGASSLAGALRVNSTLTSLCLALDGIRLDGARSILESQIENISLTNLDLPFSYVEGNTLVDMSSALACLPSEISIIESLHSLSTEFDSATISEPLHNSLPKVDWAITEISKPSHISLLDLTLNDIGVDDEKTTSTSEVFEKQNDK